MSFADPPVSKEMGYEISTTESPHKSTKFSTARILTPKKDSPLRFKQHKLKFTSTDAERSTTESDAPNESSADDASQGKKPNKPLTKTSETCPNAMTVDEQASSECSANNNVVGGNSVAETDDNDDDNLEQEVEITVDVLSFCVPDQDQTQDQNNFLCQEIMPVVPVETGDSETQQDIFDGSDTKNNGSPVQSSNVDGVDDASVHNDSADSIKLNVTNDSVIDALSTKEDNLEDTVDIQNVIGLNFTVNADEVFCGKLSRSSASTSAKNVAEQDTLPVTDSLFASLPSSQDSQCESPNNVELDPGFLDSIQPIYPALSSCREPLDAVVERLTTPFWKANLHAYFTSRNLFTVGDLAQLSEREVNRMPLRGKPKIEFVRKVLRHYESASGSACRKEIGPTSRAKSFDKTEQPLTSDEAATSGSLAPDSIEVPSASIESVSCSTPLARPADRRLLEDSSAEKSPSERSDRTISMNSDDVCPADILPERGNSDLSDSCAASDRARAKVASSPGKSAMHGKSTMLPVATSSKNLYVTVNFYYIRSFRDESF